MDEGWISWLEDWLGIRLVRSTLEEDSAPLDWELDVEEIAGFEEIVEGVRCEMSAEEGENKKSF